jgi:hypothetical protein
MTGSAFYEAYANVLVSHDLQDRLRHAPESVRRRFGLTPEELTLLCSAAPQHLHLSMHMSQGKRVAVLERMLPRTVRLLAEHDGGRTLSSYVADALRRPDVDMLRAVTHGHDFLAWLDRQPPDRLPTGLSDLARVEVAIADVRVESTAGEQDRPDPAPSSRPDGPRYPALAPGVRVVAVGCDVLRLSTEPSLAELATVVGRPGGVLLRSVGGTGRPVCHRLGAATTELLRRCDGRRSVDAVVEAVVSTGMPDQDAARAVLRRAVDESLVVLLDTPVTDKSPTR